jgi:hypothetical protein
MVWQADGCEGGLPTWGRRLLGFLRLFHPDALFIFSMAGWFRSEMRLS